MSDLSLFVPITKVDVAKRLVYGVISEEIPDKSGEILDYASAKPEFEKWSNDIKKASDGKSVGNLRAMHGNIAAGKLVDIIFDDPKKRIEGVGKVVDDGEWNKVLEGVYTGFSIGGGYAKRWNDPDHPGLKRYTPTLAEVSLVDNPCVPTATFEVIKEDGTSEMRKFTGAKEAQPDMAKADPTTERPQDKGGVEQVWKAKDGSTFLTKSEALKHNQQLDAEAVTKSTAAPVLEALEKIGAALDKKEGKTDESKAQPEPDDDKAVKSADAGDAKKAEVAARKAEPVKKGLSEVARAACLIQEFDWLHSCIEMETEWEGDNSKLPDELKAAIGSLCAFLRSLVEEETSELMGEGDEPVVEVMELAAGLPDGHADALLKFCDRAESADKLKKFGNLLAKAGARNSKADMERIQKMHDTAMELGAKCAMGGDADKAAAPEELAKVTAERDSMTKMLGDIMPQLEGIQKRIEHLEAQPLPPKGYTRAVSKAGDTGATSSGQTTDEEVAKRLEGMTAEQLNHFLMKCALRKPLVVQA